MDMTGTLPRMSGSVKQSTESARSLPDGVYVTIASVSAHIDNYAAIGRLLAAVPQGERIRTDLSRPLLVRKWHEPTGQSFCIASDGASVRCVAVSGLPAKDMRAVWARVEDLLRHREISLSACGLRDLIETELDVVADLVN
jgi:hypothetical protein